MINIEKHLVSFLKSHLIDERPLLLACSGGKDSKALFHLLLSCQKKIKFSFHIAHLDHNFRNESHLEAVSLEKEASLLNIKFFSKRLSIKPSVNIEAVYREERYNFFYQLHQKNNYQAVLLAHQQDDVIETVLKRVLEGSSLATLGGIKEISSYKGLNIYRPLLNVSTEEILLYLKNNNIDYFSDYTNKDCKYLRARMRSEILPYLNRSFEKNINKPLYRLSLRANRLREYLDDRTGGAYQSIVKGPFGFYFDYNNFLDMPYIELEHLIKRFANHLNLEMSFSVVESIVKKLTSLASNICILVKGFSIYIDRGFLFFVDFLPSFEMEKTSLLSGSYDFKHWGIVVKKQSVKENVGLGWKDLWLGECSILLPYDTSYVASLPSLNDKNPLKKRWENHKIPAFLRRIVPVIYQDNKIVSDFLTKQTKKINKYNCLLEILIKFKIKQ